MKILSAEQIARADAYTIAHEPIKSIDLMERASRSCFEWIASKYNKSHLFNVFCGVGNNGGDGLAIARLLAEDGYEVAVIVVDFSEVKSQDFVTNLKRFKKLKPEVVQTLTKDRSGFDSIVESEIIIDAIFGSGLNRPVEGFLADVIAGINTIKSEVISIDIPSGLYTDDNRKNKLKGVVKADITLSLELPKLAFLFAENQKYVGEWLRIPIGLDQKFISDQNTINHYIELEDVRKLIKPRYGFTHKGTFGHALLAAGSRGMIGAAVLMARGCLRSGVGLVTTVVPRCGYSIIQEAVPETLCKNLEEMDILSGSLDTEGYAALGIGPGIGTHKRTALWLRNILQSSAVPMVLDADAINILSDHDDLIESLPQGVVLTPHPGEFDRLAGKSKDGYTRMKKVLDYAVSHSVYVVLKGRNTTIATPEGNLYFNSTGNSGMATGGSGDVLTGLITGLLAQGYTSFEACIIGVYIHGMAGDLQAERFSEEALISSDIVAGIGEAFNTINAS